MQCPRENINNSLWQTFHFLMQAVTGKHWEGLNAVFREDAVILTPDLEITGQGRNSCICSYRRFLDSASLIEFETNTPSVTVWGAYAMIRYTYRMTWNIQRIPYRENGQETLILVLEDGSWKITCRIIDDGKSMIKDRFLKSSRTIPGPYSNFSLPA